MLRWTVFGVTLPGKGPCKMCQGAADPWARVVFEGPVVVLLMKSETGDGGGIIDNEPERQWDTFAS